MLCHVMPGQRNMLPAWRKYFCAGVFVHIIYSATRCLVELKWYISA